MDYYQAHANQNKAIGQIEDGPAVKGKAGEFEKQDVLGGKVDIEEIEIQEIHHLAKTEAVGQIS